MLAERNNQAARIPAAPTVDEASDLFIAAGGHLSPMMQFGSDPLAESCVLISERQDVLEQNIPIPEHLFACTVNGDYTPFAQSLQCMIDTTVQLQRFL